MSATRLPDDEEARERPFRLDDQDQRHQLLGRRLSASKPAILKEAESSHENPEKLASEFVAEALELSGASDGRAVVTAVVVNRVALARTIFEQIRARTDAEESPLNADVALLTGRVRPLDRDLQLEQLIERMKCDAQGNRRKAAKPLIIVATQCVEAGADLDFDALVTEAAPLDALRQRFGRLNRTGRNIEARAVILAPKGSVDKKSNDPLYGEAVRETWAFLESAGQLVKDGKQ
jgi:CRISPR-associated endonuclease/helicase Cas3